MLALAMILLPNLCQALISPAPLSHAVAPVEAPCHESAPVAPSAPGPHQTCCSFVQYPEALLSAVHVSPRLAAAVVHLGNHFFSSSRMQGRPAHSERFFAGPLNPGPLRI